MTTPLWAHLDGERVEVTAVLDRTAVYVAAAGVKMLVRRDRLVVERDQVQIHPDPRREATKRGQRMSLMRYGSNRDTSPLCAGGAWCGTPSGYSNHACRGPACTRSKTAYERDRRQRAVKESAC